MKLANKSKVATCTFAATSGGGTIPARALAFLGTGNSSQFSTLLLSSADATVDRLTVTVNATLNPTFAGGASAASPLVIQ